MRLRPRLQALVREALLDYQPLRGRSDDLQLDPAVCAVLQVEIEDDRQGEKPNEA